MIDSDWSQRRAAGAYHVDPKTVARWVARYKAEGPSGLEDRSSRPRNSPHRTPRAVIRRICRLRRNDKLKMDEIASRGGVSLFTVSRIPVANGLNRFSELDPKPPVQRYEHPHPGSLVHLDIKKLARFRVPGHRVTGMPRKGSKGIGWEHAHVTIDDHSRIAQIQMWPDETSATAWRALVATVRYFGLRSRDPSSAMTGPIRQFEIPAPQEYRPAEMHPASVTCKGAGEPRKQLSTQSPKPDRRISASRGFRA